MERLARVLYIDDDEGLRQLTARRLKRRSFDVTTAETGPAGIALLKAQRFDLVAVDHFMPGADGLETLARILAEIEDPPPVVYVTGSDESRLAVAALKAGASDYVVKTVGEDFFDLLATSFSQTLEHASLRKAAADAEAALRQTNARLEALLREVNHRVANSLQMVSAFVIMQGNAVADETAKAALRQTQQRILAIAQVHRRLYTAEELDAVDMVDYLATLLSDLEDTWSTPAAPRRLTLQCDPVRMKTDKAVALGVIVNELISNACKYAYGGEEAGEVRVSLRRDGEGRCVLRVEDDGCGFVQGLPPRGTGLGRRLISAMAAGLGSELVYEAVPRGTRARMIVPS